MPTNYKRIKYILYINQVRPQGGREGGIHNKCRIWVNDIHSKHRLLHENRRVSVTRSNPGIAVISIICFRFDRHQRRRKPREGDERKPPRIQAQISGQNALILEITHHQKSYEKKP